MSAKEPTWKQIMADVQGRPTVPLWPHAGRVYDLGKDATYKAAHAGQIEVIRIGRLLKAVTAPMRKRLGIETDSHADLKPHRDRADA